MNTESSITPGQVDDSLANDALGDFILDDDQRCFLYG
jgi:hypothetical protein